MAFPVFLYCEKCGAVEQRTATIKSVTSNMTEPPEPEFDDMCHKCTAMEVKYGMRRFPKIVRMKEIDEDEFVKRGGKVTEAEPPVGMDEVVVLRELLRKEKDPAKRAEIEQEIKETKEYYKLH